MIRIMDKSDLEEVVNIHIQAFPGFFLTLLGRKFLKELYKNFLIDEYSICLVAEEESILQGFVVGNLKPDNLFRKILLKKGYLFLLYSFDALIKRPGIVLKKLFYALNYRGELPDGLTKTALLSSIGVKPNLHNNGIGSILIQTFCKKAFMKGSNAVYLTTDKIENETVNQFYIKNGFQFESIILKSKKRELIRYIRFSHEKNI
jgi:ribosomal protein S18 acetylase RimI-like enzyme